MDPEEKYNWNELGTAFCQLINRIDLLIALVVVDSIALIWWLVRHW